MIARALVILVALAATARADSEAEQLFKEGLALFEAQQYDAACDKFEQSIKKDPRALGTLMNLGRCNERRGKVATALALYQEAFDRASESGATTAADKAQERIAALASQVPVLVIARAGPPLDGERLVVGEIVVSPSKTELPLDPGTHTLVLTAPGRLPYQQDVKLEAGKRETVTLPVLEVPKARTVVKRQGPRRALGKLGVFGGGGLAALATGLVVYAKVDYDKQFDSGACTSEMTIDGHPTCSAAGQRRTERARSIWTAGAIVGVVGLAAAATGAVLWITSPDDRERAGIVPTGSGVALIGRF